MLRIQISRCGLSQWRRCFSPYVPLRDQGNRVVDGRRQRRHSEPLWTLRTRSASTAESLKIHFRASKSAAEDRPRFTLDDVDRLSRGRPSVSKVGSRAVPHRLQADERTAFELARKRKYLIVQPSTRRYPLVNTFRNLCEALGWPNIRIEQGRALEADTVVLDLSTLDLGSSAFEAGISQQCSAVADEVLLLQQVALDRGQEVDDSVGQALVVSAAPCSPGENMGVHVGEDACKEESHRQLAMGADGVLGESLQLMKWRCSRQDSKRLAQALVQHCHEFLKHAPLR